MEGAWGKNKIVFQKLMFIKKKKTLANPPQKDKIQIPGKVIDPEFIPFSLLSPLSLHGDEKRGLK